MLWQPTYDNVAFPALGPQVQYLGYMTAIAYGMVAGHPTMIHPSLYCFNSVNRAFVVYRRFKPAGLACGGRGSYVLQMRPAPYQDVKGLIDFHHTRVAEVVNVFQSCTVEDGPASVNFDYGNRGMSDLVNTIEPNGDMHAYTVVLPDVCHDTKAIIEIPSVAKPEVGL